MAEDMENSNSSARKPWVKPTLTVHRSGFLNKFGSVSQHAFVDSIEDHKVSELVAQYGSPLFVVSEKRLRQNYQRLYRAFSNRYPHVHIGWSYKTNYLSAVCNTFHQEGAWAEVVSRFEYEKARHCGVAGDRIIFNGPHKTREALDTCIEEGAHIHIDHLDELYLVEDIAQKKNRKVNVAIRLNFDTGYTEPWSRFGFNIESGQARDAAWRITESDFLELTGLHAHIGTFVLEQRAYTQQVRIMCNFMRQVESEMGCHIDYIDIGGGFASKNALQGIYLPPEQVVPSIEQYAEAVCETLLEMTHGREEQGRKRPTLILETGRAVVDDAATLIASVVANKRLPDGRRAVILDAGVNILFTAFWYNHQVTPTRQLEGVVEDTVLYGPLCMNIDVVRGNIMLPPLEVGDTLTITPVGAYNNTQWLQFIEYRPRVVMIHDKNNVSVIREAETLDTIMELESIPAHLQLNH